MEILLHVEVIVTSADRVIFARRPSAPTLPVGA